MRLNDTVYLFKINLVYEAHIYKEIFLLYLTQENTKT